MKLIINSTTYEDLFELKFDPQTDITGCEVPINRFTSRIKTEDSISIGSYAELSDESDNTWAVYKITDSDRYDDYTVEIVAQSDILSLDRITMPAKMYSAMSISSAISEVMGSVAYTLDASFTDTITGFAPEQTARERLQWICFCIGAYIKTFFTDTIDIVPVTEDLHIIPSSETFYRPTIGYDDYVTGVKVRAYSYTQGTPQTTDKWVTADEQTYYIESTQDVTLSNPDVPSGIPENVKEFLDCKLINASNVSAIASRLATDFFMRETVDAEVLNNGAYYPGQCAIINDGADNLIQGYIKSADFTFGLQAKAKIKLGQAREIDGVNVIVKYMFNNYNVRTDNYLLPSNYDFEIETKYVDISLDGHRYILYPLVDSVTGNTGEEGVTMTVQCAIALDLYHGVMKLENVDEVDGESTVSIS